MSDIKFGSISTTVDTAFRIAQKAHHGQKRARKDPYIAHPIRVATRVSEVYRGYSKEYIDKAVSVALLHDAIEDGPSSIDEEIKDALGFDVYSLVYQLSVGTEKTPDADTYYQTYIKKLIETKNDILIAVKYMDMQDNILDLTQLTVTPFIKLYTKYSEALKILHPAFTQSDLFL